MHCAESERDDSSCTQASGEGDIAGGGEETKKGREKLTFVFKALVNCLHFRRRFIS